MRAGIEMGIVIGHDGHHGTGASPGRFTASAASPVCAGPALHYRLNGL